MAGNNSGQHNGRDVTSDNTGSFLTLDNELSGPGLLRIGRFKFRAKTDDLPQDWWFASTAFPLIAATIGPLANVLSISALVTKWKADLPDNGQLPLGADENGVGIPDPQWEIILNAISLGCGFAGNLFLLLNFMRRVRYIVALPLTIIFWYLSTGILIGILAAVDIYIPPIRPGQTYSQGFWSAIMAASLYLVGSVVLMVNMLGYFLGHYPQHFELDDNQRTLILQTIMFFIWLAGGAGIYEKVCGFQYADALYFCDVTITTVGFGDFVPNNTLGRGLLFPYAVIGIIFLGLVVNSLWKFAVGVSKEKIVKHHTMRQQQQTFGRSVTNEKEIRDRLGLPPRSNIRRRSAKKYSGASEPGLSRRYSLDQYGHFDVQGRKITFHQTRVHSYGGRGGAGRTHMPNIPLSRDAKLQKRLNDKSPRMKQAKHREKLILLREEKDRFDTMREIQGNVRKFKQYYSLCMSVLAFAILWCGGAVVFWKAEKREQDMTYFEALYFCYVSLLTIGYGDFAPKSNAGKPFFVVWSLIAIPTMTILISDMSSTVIAAINRGTFTLADWTIMPKEGVWHDFLTEHPRLREWLSRKTKEREAKKRIRHGFDVQNPDERQIPAIDDADPDPESTSLGQVIEEIEEPAEQTEHDLARKLALAIKHVANDLRAPKPKKYSYEEWVEFTRLIRFSTHSATEVEEEEQDEGLVEWDWIGEDSPMLADISESEWVLDRLCESLNRYTRRQGRATRQEEGEIKRLLEGEKKHLHRKPHHNMHYPAHPGPRKPSLEIRRDSERTDSGNNSASLQGEPLSDKEDEEGNEDEDDEVKRHIVFPDEFNDKEDEIEILPSSSGEGSGSGSKTPPNLSSEEHGKSNREEDQYGGGRIGVLDDSAEVKASGASVEGEASEHEA
ncbi:Potassium channel [Ciborinia camelliae]|nr:Potassium channel [Ciborinia camelliae]